MRRSTTGAATNALRIAEYFDVPVEVVFSARPIPQLGSAEGPAG